MPIQGVFEAIDHYHGMGWFAKGWAFNPAAPDEPVQLVLCTSEQAIQTFVANQPRQDLIAAGVGNGKHAFELKLPDSLLDGRPVNLQVMVSQEHRWLHKTAMDWFSPTVVLGRIEDVQQGRINGWATNNMLGRPPQLDVSIDGIWVASIACDIERPDLQLELACKNGAGFGYNVPQVFYDSKSHSIAFHMSNNKVELEGSPICFRMPAALCTARQRTLNAELQALQHKVRTYEDLLAKESINWLADTATYAKWLQQHEQRIEAFCTSARKTKALPTIEQKRIDDSARGSKLKAWLRRTKAEGVCFVGAQDRVHPRWPLAAALALRNKGTLVVYCDEDVRPAKAVSHSPFFKPDWDPDRHLAQNYVALACAVRTETLKQALPLLPKAADNWTASRWVASLLDLTLMLPATQEAGRIQHLPYVLYHRTKRWKAGLPGKERAALVAAQLQRSGVSAKVKPLAGDVLHIQRQLPSPAPEVVLLIPTRDRVDLLEKCVSSIQRLTDYPNYSIVIIDNDSREDATLTYLAKIASTPGVRVQHWPGAFNYAAMHNDVIATLQAPYVALINNDIEVLEPSWLSELMANATRPDVGAVGAKLLYPNGLVQHGGVVVGQHGVADNAQRAFAGSDSGYFNSLRVVQNCSAVSAACLVCRREDYLAVGGMDAKHLPIAFNDVDLCLKLRQAGKRILWTPYATLYHHESATRGQASSPEQQRREEKEAHHLTKKWNTAEFYDPCYSPNLSLGRHTHVDFRWMQGAQLKRVSGP